MFGLKDSVVAMGNYTEWRAQSRAFQQMGALEQRLFALTGSGGDAAGSREHRHCQPVRTLG